MERSNARYSLARW